MNFNFPDRLLRPLNVVSFFGILVLIASISLYAKYTAECLADSRKANAALQLENAHLWHDFYDTAVKYEHWRWVDGGKRAVPLFSEHWRKDLPKTTVTKLPDPD